LDTRDHIRDASEEQVDAAVDRIRRLFQFLQALEQLRTPVKRSLADEEWILDLSALPAHESVRVGHRQKEGEPSAPVGERAFVLAVRRAELSACPAPPEIIAEFLVDGWADPDGSVEIHSRDRAYAGGWTAVERFDDLSERVEALIAWRKERDAWAQAERPAREALLLYTRLFALWSRMQREAERFRVLLGDGRLVWDRADGGVDHPLLLVELELRFDSEAPEFFFVEADADPQLNHELLQVFPEIDGSRRARCRDLIAKTACHPLGGQETDEALRAVAQTLSPKGQLMDRDALRTPARDPRIYRQRVIFLSPRAGRYKECIEAFLDEVKDASDLPPALLQVVGMTQERTTSKGGDTDLLFTLPTNPEQEAIVRRLERVGSVQVQGPPGTGKTHTIANIIGHFLAQGKSILVTSHTTKALRVLRDKVVPELRSLCISVLDSTSQNQEELKEAVNAIVSQLSLGDASELDRQASTLAKERSRLKKRVDAAENALRKARSSEYEDLVVGAERIAPAMAARRIAEGTGIHDWIPSGVTPGAECPLTSEDLIELYRSNEELSIEDERALREDPPQPDELPTADELAHLLARFEELSELPRAENLELWQRGRPTPETLREIGERIERTIAALDDQPDWFLSCVEAGMLGGEHRKAWDELIEIAENGDESIAQLSRGLLDFEVKHEPAPDLDPLLAACAEILAHMDKGGGLGFFGTLGKPAAWKALLEHAAVNGHPPREKADFEALRAHLEIERTRARLRRRFGQLLTPGGAPPPDALGAAPETHGREYVRRLRAALAFGEKEWPSCVRDLVQLGLSFDRLLDRAPIEAPPHALVKRTRRCATETVLPLIADRRRTLELESVKRKGQALVDALGLHPSSRIALRLVKSVGDRDSKSYARGMQELVRLSSIRPVLERRDALLTQLSPVAPAWARAIGDRTSPHDRAEPPGDCVLAWRHRQWTDELDRRAAADLDDLQGEVSAIKRAFQEATARYVARRAWGAQIARTDLEQQQALRGWLNHIVRIGKGTGVRAEELRREARKLQIQCRSAVPVWIMPLSRVIENYDVNTTKFDVVIIDEASQSDLLALFVFALGHKVVVVGDDEQVSPLAIGQSQEQIAALIDQWLEGIPNRLLYDGRRSVYDIASESFAGGLLRLVEHFRCVPEIISFSNQLSYNGEIRALRDASDVEAKPSVVVHEVADGCADESNVNQAEAMEIASLLVAATMEPEYAHASMGVISVIGEEQALAIDALLQRFLPASEYGARRIVCGTAANFQGDERDVMFLSIVSSSRDGPLRLMADDAFKKRLNVAASRAKDQMWIVHSLDPHADLKEGDLRLRLIKHALDAATDHESSAEDAPAATELVGRVIRALEAKGYRVRTGVRIGSHVVDIMVIGERARAAIECDGDRILMPDALEVDQRRQAILERLGWRFVRVRASVFHRDPDKCIASVVDRLRQMHVSPAGPGGPGRQSRTTPGLESIGSGRDAPTKPERDLRARVVQRAAELRKRWARSRRDGSL
jgi:very-short-patch-repair endonuclease